MKIRPFKIGLLLVCMVWAAVLPAQEDFRKNPPKPGPAPKIELGEAHRFSLDNGLQVIVVENHKLPRVSIQVFVDAPPVKEEEKAGYIQLAGEMLGRGTAQRSKAEIDEAVDFIGASFNTSSSGLFGAALTKHADELLRIMSEVLLEPSFPAEEFDKVKKQTMSRLAQEKEDPNAIAGKVARVLRYGKEHPYGEIETEQSIENISVEDCKAYYETWFKPNISYLIVVGDVTPAQARSWAEKYFGSWQAAEAPPQEVPAAQPPEQRVVDFVNRNGAVQSVINITYPVDFQPGAPHAIQAQVMNTLLGGFFSSRLNANLREDKGYTYGVRSTLSSDRYVGYFNAGGSVRNEVTDSALVEFLKEMQRLREEPVPEEELTLVKNVISGSFARQLESPQTVANYYLNIARYDLPEDYYATYLERLSTVTSDDVQAMARRYVLPDRAHILVVGNKEEVADKLAPFSADGQVHFYDQYGTPLELEALTPPEGLTARKVIEDYIQALGGRERLAAVRSLKTVSSANVQGMDLSVETIQAAPARLAVTVSMGGNVMMETKFDGEKGAFSQMGQTQPMPEEMAAQMKVEARLFPELYFAEEGIEPTLTGMEMLDGKKAYVVEVPLSGGKQIMYFDAETGLKLRQVSERETTDFADYREVEGIRFPFSITVSGSMPAPLAMKVQSIELNTDIPEEAFKVE